MILDDVWNAITGIFTLISVPVLIIFGIVVIAYDFLLQGIIAVTQFIASALSFVYTTTGLIYNVLGDIMSINPYAAIIFSLLMFGVSAKITIIVYNVVAGTEILGFKLPRLPE